MNTLNLMGVGRVLRQQGCQFPINHMKWMRTYNRVVRCALLSCHAARTEDNYCCPHAEHNFYGCLAGGCPCREEYHRVVRCELCGEGLKLSDEQGEFALFAWNPSIQDYDKYAEATYGRKDALSAIAHQECGLAAGLTIA